MRDSRLQWYIFAKSRFPQKMWLEMSFCGLIIKVIKAFKLNVLCVAFGHQDIVLYHFKIV